MTVEGGKAFFFDFRMARMATAENTECRKTLLNSEMLAARTIYSRRAPRSPFSTFPLPLQDPASVTCKKQVGYFGDLLAFLVLPLKLL